jgi:hypothetical protein
MSEVIKSCDNCVYDCLGDNCNHPDISGRNCNMGKWQPDYLTLQLQLQQNEKELEEVKVILNDITNCSCVPCGSRRECDFWVKYQNIINN